MITIKNIRPGILVIPDAGLRLTPGQTATVGQSTKQVEQLIASGHLARVGEAGKADNTSDSGDMTTSKSSESPATSAPVAPVSEVAPPSLSTPTAPSEKATSESVKQRSVLETLAKKRQEVGGGAE